MESSILESIGVEIIGVMSPVSICMLLVVLLVYSLSSADPLSSASAQIRTAANLVYLESPSDSATQKLEGALLNALVFVILIAVVTFLLVLLYYYNFTNFLKNYMRFSAFFVLGTMGGSIFLSIIQHFSIPVDSITCFVLLFNFTVVGVLSVFSGGIPILLRQVYMVLLGIIVAAWFTKLPEWTTWALLVALAVYDLVAVLAPGGPLKLLVELASSRDEELPALVYEARPTVPRNGEGRRSNMGLLVGGVSESGSVELQAVSRDNVERDVVENCGNSGNSVVEVHNFRNEERENGRDEEETSPLVGNSWERTVVIQSDRAGQFGNRESEIVVNDEMSPLVELMGLENEREQTTRDGPEVAVLASRGSWFPLKKPSNKVTEVWKLLSFGSVLIFLCTAQTEETSSSIEEVLDDDLTRAQETCFDFIWSYPCCRWYTNKLKLIEVRFEPKINPIPIRVEPRSIHKKSSIRKQLKATIY